MAIIKPNSQSKKLNLSVQIKPQEIDAMVKKLNDGQLAIAETSAKALISRSPSLFILHHVLSLALDGQHKTADAIESYKNALKLQPNTPDILFNLGIALTQINALNDAANCYKKAIAIKPDFFEAYGNLGTILQRQGKLQEAILSYSQGLKINPKDARGYFNCATALRDNGDLQKAINNYLQAIKLFSNYTDAHNNLGETWRDLGDMPAAVKCYQTALALNPKHPNANYNMAEFLVLSQQYEAAIAYFEASLLDDWQIRCLYCLYKAQHFDAFKLSRNEILNKANNSQIKHTSPFLATLSTHYSINFNEPDPYNFCKNGLDFVYRNALPALSANSQLLKDLLHDINTAHIVERKQGRLTNGQQSAGNLFKRDEASFKALAELIKQEFLAYKAKFTNDDCELIKSFPTELEFTSSWYVKMQQGGHLNAHIHEIGWLSGAVYLAMPTLNGLEGAFEYGTHGDDYPQILTQFSSEKSSGAKFPTAHILPNVGDIVLFPSSLFHRTIPFSANQERICIAFDLKPA